MTQTDILEQIEFAGQTLSQLNRPSVSDKAAMLLFGMAIDEIKFLRAKVAKQTTEITTLRAQVAEPRTPNAPDENGFFIGQKVEKFSGDYQTIGEIRARYTTCKGAVRYVVEIEPQGFQHIFTAGSIRALL